MDASASTSTAQTRWEIENGVQPTDNVDSYYAYNAAEQQAIQQQRPWTKDPQYFKRYSDFFYLLITSLL